MPGKGGLIRCAGEAPVWVFACQGLRSLSGKRTRQGFRGFSECRQYDPTLLGRISCQGDASGRAYSVIAYSCCQQGQVLIGKLIGFVNVQLQQGLLMDEIFAYLFAKQQAATTS